MEKNIEEFNRSFTLPTFDSAKKSSTGTPKQMKYPSAAKKFQEYFFKLFSLF